MSILLFSLDSPQLTAAQIAALEENIPPGLTLVQSRDAETIKELAGDIEVLAGWFEPAWLLEMPRLRWVQMWSAGANWLMRFPELRDAPFTLTSAVGVHAVPISEHVFALLLAYGRNLRNAFAAQEQGIWAGVKHPTEPLETSFSFFSGSLVELAGKTLLLLGVGAIGERVAKLAQAFDMTVIGLRNHPEKSSAFVDEMVGPADLHDALGAADFVVNTLPLTTATQCLLGEPEFRAMKPGAFLVNIGRGKTIDERALTAALQKGIIAGAGLDVFENEPLPEESPLWAMPNVLITSHYSGASTRYHERAFEILLHNLQRYQDGRPLRNVVDKQRGY